eukprot:scaffold1729_cov375-Prasinococcus_capsulatus_cf.AAC.2
MTLPLWLARLWRKDRVKRHARAPFEACRLMVSCGSMNHCVIHVDQRTAYYCIAHLLVHAAKWFLPGGASAGRVPVDGACFGEFRHHTRLEIEAHCNALPACCPPHRTTKKNPSRGSIPKLDLSVAGRPCPA